MKFISNKWMSQTKKGKRQDEKTLQTTIKRKLLFQLSLIEKDEAKKIENTEIDEISFEEVASNLEKEESIFVTKKQKQKLEKDIFVYDTVKEPWYF